MPTYDYKCKNCNDTFEHFQKMTDDPLKVCNKCGNDLTRLIGTGLSPVFKGKGFYETDYKSNNTKAKKSEKHSKTDLDKSEKQKATNKVEKKSA